jgi:hypothetical protein
MSTTTLESAALVRLQNGSAQVSGTSKPGTHAMDLPDANAHRLSPEGVRAVACCWCGHFRMAGQRLLLQDCAAPRILDTRSYSVVCAPAVGAAAAEHPQRGCEQLRLRSACSLHAPSA